MIRRAVPYTLLPLSVIACALASAPWLRAFPSAVLAVPLFGAAVLSLLAPVVVVGIGVRRMWTTALIDLVLFTFYELLVTLREPVGFSDLYVGLVHGPSQILSFALPLVSPRTLLVAPVALCWLCGALIGECLARGWQTVLPFLVLLVTFGLAYAGTARAVTSSADGRRYDTLLAGALLLTLLLLRAAQAWVTQQDSAETTQPEGVLPLRGLGIGVMLALLVTAGAAGLVQSDSFAGRPVTPARVPPLDQSRPLTPVAFVAGLRPADPGRKGQPLFKVSTDRATTNYVALASVDYYDGDSWSFSRTFRPSGGVLPADSDPTMRTRGPAVTQQYTIGPGALTSVPWMPHLDRAERVSGASVDIDSTSGMIVPAHPLRAGESYTVRSAVPDRNFMTLGHGALIGTSAAQVDTSLPNGLAVPLGTLIGALEQETGVASSQPVPFLQAVVHEFRTKSGLAGAPASGSSASPSGAPFVAPLGSRSPKGHGSTHRSPRSTARPTPSPTPTASPHTGGTTFADVLASIRGAHSGTPEQFATLTALIARKLGIPARVVSGFRIALRHGERLLPQGAYEVTTAQAWSWVQIPVRGLGWVVLDPSPGTYAGQTPPPAGGAPSPSPSPRPSQNAQLTHSNNGGHAVAGPSRTPHGTGLSALALFVIVLASVVVAIGCFLVFLLARKQARRRRRRGLAEPRARLLGAWQESLDVLAEMGVPDLVTATSSEVVLHTRDRFGSEPAQQVRHLGDAANIAIFHPTSAIEADEADAAWRVQAKLARTVRGQLGWRDRVRARLRYNRPPRSTAAAGPVSWLAETRARHVASKPGKHARHRRPVGR